MEGTADTIRASAVRWTLFALIILGVLALGFVLFSPVIQVRQVQVTRLSPRLDIEDVQQTLAPTFGKHLFFLSSFEVATLLKEHIPDIDEVKIGKTYPSTLHVRIGLRPLVARLRILEPDENVVGTGATIDFLTDQGIYVATTAAQDTATLPEIHIVDWGVRPDPGSKLIQPIFLERMNAAELTLLRQFGQEVTERTIFVRAQEFHMRIGRLELWFDIKSPLEDQLQRYRTFLREVNIDDVKDYIDLRIADRVVYQ